MWNNAIESEKYPGFYYCSIPGILIGKEGKNECIVIDALTGEEIKASCNGYWEYLSVSKGGITKSLHRLMAETFITCPGIIDQMYVDHKDGNKLNNSLSNLEWVTAAENAIRAYKQGLRTDNREIHVRDIRNNEIRSFYSLQECARWFRRNGQAIFTFLNGKKNAPFMKFYDLRYDYQDWSDLSSADINKVSNGLPKEIVVEVIGTNTLIVFASIAEASKFTGNASSHIGNRLKLDLIDRQPMGNFKYYNRWEIDEGIQNVEIRQSTRKMYPLPVRKPVPIVVVDVLTNQTIAYDSTEAFAKIIGAKKNTIQKSILVNKGFFRNYYITYQVATKSDLSETVG